MKPIIFTGSAVALVTPTNPDFSVNYDKMDELIEWHIAQGTDAIITCGTTGETSVQTDEEHIDVMVRTVKTVNGRVPVVAGVGSNDTRYAAWLTKEAAAAGADALLHVTPYYNKTSQAGLVQHFNFLADLTDLPVILYNVPSRTGMTIQPATYKDLAKHPNIVATKEASGDFSNIARTIALCGDELAVYSGNDDQVIPLMALGGIGVISVLANVAPKFTHAMCQAWLDGNTAAASKMQIDCIPLCEALFCDVNPIPVKEALNQMGYNVGECRLPLVPPSATHKAFIREQLTAFHLL